MLPFGLDIVHFVAIALIFFALWAYEFLLRLLGTHSLNFRLAVARRQWVARIPQRDAKPFDAIMIGHIVNSISFFGSATLIVLAGLFSAMINVDSIYQTADRLHFIGNSELSDFAVNFAVLIFVIGISFFSFTYALRKLVYFLALAGALPNKPTDDPDYDAALAEEAAIVLGEAVRTLNFGIRGYYYAIAAVMLFVSPWASIAATLVATGVLIYRQTMTRTSRAIKEYVAVTKARADQ